MKKAALPFIVLLLVTSISSAQLGDVLNKAKEEAEKKLKNGGGLSNDDVIKGLKEALTVGTNNSTSLTSKLDGFNKNALIRIPFPQEAKRVKDEMVTLGMKKQVDKFELTLNRAAEEASKEAAPIFINAVKGMTISDGFAILKGKDDAATSYLNDKTNSQLYQKFKPSVKNAIEKVQLTQAWTPIVTTYNKIPGVKKQNPDLDEYVTNKAINGLMVMIADEEIKIRKDPVARVSDLLKKVFGGNGP